MTARDALCCWKQRRLNRGRRRGLKLTTDIVFPRTARQHRPAVDVLQIPVAQLASRGGGLAIAHLDIVDEHSGTIDNRLFHDLQFALSDINASRAAKKLQRQFEEAQRKMAAASIDQSDVPASERQAQAILDFARRADV